MERGYRYVSHTADVEFIAAGRDMPELFRNAALALFNISADTKALEEKGGRATSFVVNVSATDYESLLWKALQYCLSMADIKDVFCYGMTRPVIRTGKKTTFKAVAYCRKREERFSKLEAKGVSKYLLSVSRKRGTLTAKVVVDV